MTVPLWYQQAGSDRRPRTHAIVIGVSRYPNRPFGLPDLPASVVSALSFATWLRDDQAGYRPPQAPLGSIRLLLAATEAEQKLVDGHHPERIGSADRQTVMDALHQWQADCCSDSRNVAVLYVAGHGFRETREGALVLMQDAGRSPKVFDEALDIEGIRDALTGEGAPHRQYYFVDACREIAKAPEFSKYKRPLKGGVTPYAREERERFPAPVYYAAAADMKAYQNVGGSVFIEALRLCLRLDAVQRGGPERRWMVKANRLQEALPERVRQIAAWSDKDQESDTGGTAGPEPFTYADHPLVPFTLDVVPVDGRDGAWARIYNEERDQEPIPETSIPIENREVPAGTWSVGLRFDPPPPRRPKYRPYQGAPIVVDPPRYDRPLTLR